MSFALHIPERRTAIRSTLACPERVFVAWHRDCEGIHELLDEQGRNRYGHPPQDTLWEVREYARVIHYPDAGEAFYEGGRCRHKT